MSYSNSHNAAILQMAEFREQSDYIGLNCPKHTPLGLSVLLWHRQDSMCSPQSSISVLFAKTNNSDARIMLSSLIRHYSVLT